MANGKDIEIRMAATGGDQAAAEVRKPTDALDAQTEAVKELTEAEKDYQQRKEAFDARVEANRNAPSSSGEGDSRGFGGMLDAVPQKAEAAAEAVEKVATSAGKVAAAAKPMSESLGKVTDDMDAAGKAAETAEDKLDRIANNQRAEVVGKLAEMMGKLGAKVRAASDEFKEADPKMSKSLGNIATGLETAENALTFAAAGFAVGGPFGAAIGALAGSLIPEFNRALDTMVGSLAREAQAKKDATEMARKLAEMQSMGVDAYWAATEASDRLKQSTEDATAAIDAQTSALERRNRIQNAEDSAYKAKRDREDAQAIRNGEAPEDVRSRRASDDAAMEIRKIDREEEVKQAGLRDARNAVVKAEGERDVIAVSPNATPDQIAEAEKAVAETKKRAQEMEDAAKEASRIADARRREVTEREAAKIEDLQGSKQERLAREQAAKDAKDEADKRKQEQAEASARRDAERNASGNDREAAALGRQAVSLVPKGASDNFRRAVEGAAAALQDGAQGDELDRMASLLEKLVPALKERDALQASKVETVNRRIATLEAQMRNGRKAGE